MVTCGAGDCERSIHPRSHMYVHPDISLMMQDTLVVEIRAVPCPHTFNLSFRSALWLHGNFSLELNAVKKVCKLKEWVIPESCEAELVGF
jgi:hypothetical protein